MASSRTPKGTYSRNSPDWLTTALYVASAYSSIGDGSTDEFVTFAFYNDSAIGLLLYIYGICAFLDVNVLLVMDRFTGPFGSLIQQGQSVRLDSASGPGQMRMQTTAQSGNTDYPNPDVTTPLWTLPSQSFGNLLEFGAPLWIVQPHESLRFGTMFTVGTASMTIWYLAAGSN